MSKKLLYVSFSFHDRKDNARYDTNRKRQNWILLWIGPSELLNCSVAPAYLIILKHVVDLLIFCDSMIENNLSIKYWHHTKTVIIIFVPE